MTINSPYLTVVVPAHQAEAILSDTLGALVQSDLPRSEWELIVVDDASSDGTAGVAAAFADVVVRLSGDPHGPAYARNRGVEIGRGDVIAFVDSDVRVRPDALSRLVQLFRTEPDVGAAFGSYDADPPAPGLVSRWRNLLHHYHHHRGAGDAGTFWAGLGAIRAEVFREVGGFDEWRYERPQIEDIELGRRIALAGHRIRLAPGIQGSHLKRWSLGDVVRTDLLHRGIPWMTLLLREGGGGDQLNVKLKEKVCVALLGAALLVPFVALLLGSWMLLWLFPALLATIVVLNLEYYRYMARCAGWAFALGVIPLHLLYYLVSGLAAVFGHLAHIRGLEPLPSERTRELHARGVVSWPPVPSPPRSSIWDLGR